MKKNILVSGLINIETTLKIEKFPLNYFPVTFPFYGIGTTISGVGFNIAAALSGLGDEVQFLSLIGNDSQCKMVRESLKKHKIPSQNVLCQLESTPQSVIIYDGQGKRQIHVDLKDIQESKYDQKRFLSALEICDTTVLCNTNYSRNFLKLTQESGKMIFTDVHTLSDIHDPYNKDFMEAANVLFLSDEHLPCSPEEFVDALARTYHNDIIIVGLGSEGALLYVKKDNYIRRLPAVSVRPVVNTIGAGDALFSAFTHYFTLSNDPYLSLKKAIIFAGYKIGDNGAANGLLSHKEFEKLYSEHSF